MGIVIPKIFIRKLTIARRVSGLSAIVEALPVFINFPMIKPEVSIFTKLIDHITFLDITIKRL